MATFLDDGTKQTEKPLKVQTFENILSYSTVPNKAKITSYSDSIIVDYFEHETITNHQTGKSWVVKNIRQYRYVLKADYSVRYQRYHLQGYVLAKGAKIARTSLKADEDLMRSVLTPEICEIFREEAYKMAAAKNSPTPVRQNGKKDLTLLVYPMLAKIPEQAWHEDKPSRFNKAKRQFIFSLLKTDYKVGYALRSKNIQEAAHILYGKHVKRNPNLLNELVDPTKWEWSWLLPLYRNVVNEAVTEDESFRINLRSITTYGVGTFARYMLFAAPKDKQATLIAKMAQFVSSSSAPVRNNAQTSELLSNPLKIMSTTQEERVKLLQIFENKLDYYIQDGKTSSWMSLDIIIKETAAYYVNPEKQEVAGEPKEWFSSQPEFRAMMDLFANTPGIRLFETSGNKSEYVVLNTTHPLIGQFKLTSQIPAEAKLTAFKRQAFLHDKGRSQRKALLAVLTCEDGYLFAKKMEATILQFLNKNGWELTSLTNTSPETMKIMSLFNRKHYRDQRRMMMLLRNKVPLDSIDVCYANRLKKEELHEYVGIPAVWLEELFA